MQTMTFAGGLATRLGEITKNNPESLFEIRGKPFLEYRPELLQENGILA